MSFLYIILYRKTQITLSVPLYWTENSSSNTVFPSFKPASMYRMHTHISIYGALQRYKLNIDDFQQNPLILLSHA